MENKNTIKKDLEILEKTTFELINHLQFTVDNLLTKYQTTLEKCLEKDYSKLAMRTLIGYEFVVRTFTDCLLEIEEEEN
ncbi:hypothetical protein [Leptospira bandrabouensis]|uniref:hypothetical protein n=1 Tax=Leptospira bandrabouensis TaxID=2484903 RepID=UPI0010917EC7|nr:hypothetical protein [Leptospira bandrabouensis]TGN03616.1 hypothetical protein EHR07_17435 [Leptospira bandrabouensis]